MANPAPTPRPAPANGSRPPGVPTTQPSKAKSKLGTIQRGQLRSSLRHLFYGPEGVGKSSLAANAPAPLFLDIEGGADNLDAARYPFRDEPGGHVPRELDEVTAAIEDLIANPGHGYETLVIDTIDALEALVHKHICKANGKGTVEDFGFGKGYNVALDEFRRLFALLDTIRGQGVQVVLVGHSFVKTFKNPEGEDFDRYQLRVHEKAGGLIKEWCDVVGFIHFDGGSAKIPGDTGQSKRARGWSTGARIVELHREAAWDAKSRLTLPATLELGVADPWAPFALASMGARNADTRTLTEVVVAELDRIGADEFTSAAGKKMTRQAVLAMAATADASTLSRIVAGLQATESVTTSKES